MEATVLLRRVMEEIDLAVFAFDSEQRLRLVNRAAETTLGIVEDCRGESFDRFLRPDQRTPLWTALAATTRRSEANPSVALRRDVIGLRANGDEFPLEVSVSDTGDGIAHGLLPQVFDLFTQGERPSRGFVLRAVSP